MRLPFPEQRTNFDDSGFVNLEPRDYWAECYGCFGKSATTSGGGGGGGSSSQPKGNVFGVNGRSVTGSTAKDAAIGYTSAPGSGKPGPNYEELTSGSRVERAQKVRAALAKLETQRQQEDDNKSDPYGVGQAGEMSTAAMAAPTVAPPAVATGSYDDGPTKFAQNQLGAGPRPEARVTKRPKPSNDLMTVFPGVLGNSIFAGSQGRDEPIDRNLALTALQDRALAGDLVAQRELDDLGRRGAINFAEANYAMLQQQKGIDASRILNQAPVTAAASTPIQVDDGTGVAAPRPGAGLGSFITADGQTRTSISPQDRQILADGLGVSDGGYEDDPAYDVDIFGTPRYAGGQVGLDGKLQGFENARQMADFIDKEVEPSGLQKLLSLGPTSMALQAITGKTVEDYNRDAIRKRLESGAVYNTETGRLEGGEVDRPVVTGGGGGGGGFAAPQPMFDPCPEGFKLVDGVCQPIEAAEERVAGSSFQQTPTTNLPTTFAPTTQATPVGAINPFVLRPTQIPGFAMGGEVDEEEAELSEAITGSYTTAGGGKATGFSYSDGMGGGDDDGGTQTVIATPINTQGDDDPYQVTTAQANQLNQQAQLNQAAIDARNQRQAEADLRNQEIQASIDRLNQLQENLNAPSQPGLANTIMQGALDIFTNPITKPDPSAALPPPTQNLPMNPNMQGQVGDISKQGQIQGGANVQDITQSADQAVSGINQAQFTNVMPESGGFSVPTPEEFREMVGLPDDVAGAVGDFLSGIGQSIVGNPNKIADNFNNLGSLKPSSRVYGSQNYKGTQTGSSFNPFR